jgi:thymidylate synthase
MSQAKPAGAFNMTSTFDSTEEAWRAVVRSVAERGDNVPGVQDPLSIGSKFGRSARDTRELIATQIAIRNPRARLIVSEARPFRLDFAIAQVIWALSGSDELEPLAFYHHRGSEFSDNGSTVRSAIGRRVFRSRNGDQLLQAIDKIRNDRSTRRALIQIYLPEDLFLPSRDVSCTGSIHLLARGSRLHAVGQMRSQSATVVLPYDLFLLTMLHEFASVCAGLELGTYWHVCNSAHIYEDEMHFTKAVLDELLTAVQPMPAMPVSTPSEIAELVEAERIVRHSLMSMSETGLDVRSLSLSTYWQDLLATMIADWKLRHGYSWSDAGIDNLPELYQRPLAMADRNSVNLTRSSPHDSQYSP